VRATRTDDDRGQPSQEDTGSFAGQDELAVHLSELARDLQDQPTLQATLERIVEAAVANVPGACMAGISQVEDRHRIDTPAGTDELVFRVDRAQYDVGEGPCLSTIYEDQTVRLPDTGTDDRWPKFSRVARELGVGSMLSFQLYVKGTNLGALNLYSPEPNAFDDECEHIGLLFAGHAGVAFAGSQRQAQLNHAIAGRDLIGQAKGILMERFKITSEQAFGLLVRASQTGNVKLRDVAERLVSSGELAGRDPGPQSGRGSGPDEEMPGSPR